MAWGPRQGYVARVISLPIQNIQGTYMYMYIDMYMYMYGYPVCNQQGYGVFSGISNVNPLLFIIVAPHISFLGLFLCPYHLPNGLNSRPGSLTEEV